MNRRERVAAITRVTSAYRETGRDGTLRPAPDWYDLDPEDRAEAFDETVLMRTLERAADGSGFTSTVQAVLGRIQDEH